MQHQQKGNCFNLLEPNPKMALWLKSMEKNIVLSSHYLHHNFIFFYFSFFTSHHLPDKAVLSKKIVSYVLIVSVPTDSASATVSPTAENKTLISINSLKVYRPFWELNFNLIISDCHKICDILQSTKNTFFWETSWNQKAETRSLFNQQINLFCQLNNPRVCPLYFVQGTFPL